MLIITLKCDAVFAMTVQCPEGMVSSLELEPIWKPIAGQKNAGCRWNWSFYTPRIGTLIISTYATSAAYTLESILKSPLHALTSAEIRQLTSGAPSSLVVCLKQGRPYTQQVHARYMVQIVNNQTVSVMKRDEHGKPICVKEVKPITCQVPHYIARTAILNDFRNLGQLECHMMTVKGGIVTDICLVQRISGMQQSNVDAEFMKILHTIHWSDQNIK